MNRREEILVTTNAFSLWDNYFRPGIEPDKTQWLLLAECLDVYCLAEQIEAEWRGLA